MWYAAVMVVSSKIEENPNHRGSVDLQVKLLEAASDEEAFSKAIERGKSENISYLNELGETVVWTFEGLYDLVSLGVDELFDDIEVFNFLSKRNCRDLVQPKEKLQVFWDGHNADRTAGDILDDDA